MHYNHEDDLRDRNTPALRRDSAVVLILMAVTITYSMILQMRLL